MSSYIREGKVVYITNTTDKDIKYGDTVVLVDRIGVSASDIVIGDVGSVYVSGVFDFSAVNSEEFVIGDTVYTSDTGITKTKAEGAIKVGWVVEHKDSSSSVAHVKID